ncbi:hypothetical protein V6Z12_A09G058600 [Gossypium hirsutum]
MGNFIALTAPIMRPFPYLAITPVPANLVSILKLASKFISINVSPGCFQLEGHRGVSSGPQSI